MASFEEYQQKRERDRLIQEGVKPKEASKRAKEKFPLSKGKATKKKNRQPGGGADDPGRGGGGSGRGRHDGTDYYRGSSSNFGKR